jgi:hypothetical protein
VLKVPFVLREELVMREFDEEASFGMGRFPVGEGELL